MEKNRALSKILFPIFFIVGFGSIIWKPSFALGGTLTFSKPERLVTLPWTNGSNHGVPPTGVEWLMVDKKGSFTLESNLDFAVFSPQGQYLRTLNPLDKSKNFYGFTAMEVLPDGALALLARLESPQEQWGKDNFEEHSKPGSRLIVLSPEGAVKLDKEETDSDQPHSNYYLENEVVYSVHDDGTFQTLDSLGPKASQDHDFGNYASFAYDPERWLQHIQGLPVFRSANKIYHDTKGGIHQIKGAASFLMERPFVEGLGPLAERNGKIYYQVVSDKNGDFVNAVFVEDTHRKSYALVDLLHADEDLDMPHGHAVFVDPQGNLFEGVGKKDGYRIYEWKIGK